MSINIEDVPKWHIDGGISHAVVSVRDPGAYTACETLHWGVFQDSLHDHHNNRICRKCRAALASDQCSKKGQRNGQEDEADGGTDRV